MTLTRFACLLLLMPCTRPIAVHASTRHRSTALSSAVPVRASTLRPPTDSSFKSWYFTPTGVFGRIPLDRPKNRYYIRLSRPSATESVIENINPAGIVVNTTHVYLRNGLIALSTETDRWGETYDSVWYRPDGPDKFLVSERKRGVNPFLPCKYVQYSFNNNLLTDVVCYLDSIRAGADQEGVAHYVYERYNDPDRRGLIKSESYFTEIDMPAFSSNTDCHKLENEYDAKGNLISSSVYDQDDKASIDRYGVFRTKYKYDGDDNPTEIAYYSTFDQLVTSTRNYAIEYIEYKHGFPSEESYFLDVRTHAVCGELGPNVSIVDHKYDQDGNEISTRYYNTDDQPVNNDDNIQEIDNVYSPSGMLIEKMLIPVTNDFGSKSKVYLTAIFSRDAKGRIAEQHFQSNTGLVFANPTTGSNVTKYSYDAWGRTRTTSYWQDDSTKMTSGLGYHEDVDHYDNDGQLAEVDYLDEDGKPATATLGYSVTRVRRNAQGLMAERSFFDGDRPVLLQDERASVTNFHRQVYSYDLLNRLRSVAFFDQKGQPATASLRPSRQRTFTADEIDLDYNGDLLKTETFKGPGDSLTAPILNCDSGKCPAISGIISPLRIRSATSMAAYHGNFHPDSLFGGQIGFVGQDTILVFMNANRQDQIEDSCSEYYRIAPITQYYQLEGRVVDYFMDNDSVAATFTYKGGYLEGPVCIYDHNGAIREKGSYHNNARYGSWEYYYDNGQKERTLYYGNGQPLLIDCYSRTGEVLAKDGNGHFEGMVTPPSTFNDFQVLAKGAVKNGLPDGEWNLYTKTISGPANTEYFTNGKFRHGVSYSLVGKSTYSDRQFTSLEGAHNYQNLDAYTWAWPCRNIRFPLYNSDLYPEIRNGFVKILQSNKYGAYTGWVFLDVTVDSTGKVKSCYVRLCHPDPAFEKDIRDMAALLPYPTNTRTPATSTPYEKMYIILVGGNQIAIPEELLQAQRRRFR